MFVFYISIHSIAYLWPLNWDVQVLTMRKRIKVTGFSDWDSMFYNNLLSIPVLAAFSIPIKLKYDCPPASKFGKEQPLWKTATTGFLRIVREIAGQIRALGDRTSVLPPLLPPKTVRS